jgi:hypothetical protein
MALTYDQISAITEKKFIPKLQDNIFDSNALFKKLNAKKKKLDGGTSVIVPLNYAQSTAGGWYSGADTLSTVDNEVITGAEFQWAQQYQTISITGRDELKNMGDAQKVDFVKSKVQIAEKTMRDTFGTGLYNAGSDSKAIIGSRAFVTTGQTYGGISQVTYSWWQAQVDSTTTTLSISAMQSLWGSCTVDSDKPSMLISVQNIFDKYYALLQPQQRFTDEETAKGGFTNLMFNGAPYVVDSHAPSNYLYMFNLDYLDLYVHNERDFKFEKFEKPINQDVRVAKILWMGALASSNNRMHGVLSAITA